MCGALPCGVRDGSFARRRTFLSFAPEKKPRAIVKLPGLWSAPVGVINRRARECEQEDFTASAGTKKPLEALRNPMFIGSFFLFVNPFYLHHASAGLSSEARPDDQSSLAEKKPRAMWCCRGCGPHKGVGLSETEGANKKDLTAPADT